MIRRSTSKPNTHEALAEAEKQNISTESAKILSNYFLTDIQGVVANSVQTERPSPRSCCFFENSKQYPGRATSSKITKVPSAQLSRHPMQAAKQCHFSHHCGSSLKIRDDSTLRGSRNIVTLEYRLGDVNPYAQVPSDGKSNVFINMHRRLTSITDHRAIRKKHATNRVSTPRRAKALANRFLAEVQGV